MRRMIIFSLLLLSICVTGFSQNSINNEILDNFYEYRGEIIDYFSYYYLEDYSNEMLYYNSKLMTIFGNIIDRKVISDEIIDLIIDLYKKTISLKVPDEDKEMYIEAGLGKKGHEFYTKIVSIMYFMMLESNINNFPEEDKVIVKNGVEKLKKLFAKQEWDITVNYFNNKRNSNI